MEIPKSLFDSLQTSLLQEAKRICRDAAKILNVPEKELQAKVLKNMPKISIINDNDKPYSCPVLVESAIIERCRKPCLLGTGRCQEHQKVETIPEPTDQTTLTRIQSEYKESLWCNEIDGTVYTRENKQVGNYKNGKLFIYVFE